MSSDQSSNSDFDPDRSNRETRKLARKIYTERRYNAVFDANGKNVATGKDSCDCLKEQCPGCHFPCLKCRSLKCGHECRQNRRWHYYPDIEVIKEKAKDTPTTVNLDD